MGQGPTCVCAGQALARIRPATIAPPASSSSPNRAVSNDPADAPVWAARPAGLVDVARARQAAARSGSRICPGRAHPGCHRQAVSPGRTRPSAWPGCQHTEASRARTQCHRRGRVVDTHGCHLGALVHRRDRVVDTRRRHGSHSTTGMAGSARHTGSPRGTQCTAVCTGSRRRAALNRRRDRVRRPRHGGDVHRALMHRRGRPVSRSHTGATLRGTPVPTGGVTGAFRRHTRRRRRRSRRPAARVRRVAPRDAVVAIALVAVVVVSPVRVLPLGVLVVGLAHAARTRLAGRLAATIAVAGGRTVTGRLVLVGGAGVVGAVVVLVCMAVGLWLVVGAARPGVALGVVRASARGGPLLVELCLVELVDLVLLLEETAPPEPADAVEACPDCPLPDPGADGLSAYAGALSVNPSRTTTPIRAQSLVSAELVQRDDFMSLRIPVELVVEHSDHRRTPPL